MKIKRLHSWQVPYTEAIALQKKLCAQLIIDDSLRQIGTIAGADISYDKGSDLFFAAVVVMDYPSLTVVDEASFSARISFPYIPGLLSFREGPALLPAFAGLAKAPDVIIFDGQGIAHPRGIGLASHMGLFLDIPSIGCAKTLLVGRHDPVGEEAGESTVLIYQERIIGTVLRTKKKVKPVFVSPGHRIGFKQAAKIVLSCCRGYRLPEPTRLAHLAVNRLRRQSH
ncbi:MAG: deoxyribonuclease V [Smithellaceae bacterium]|nr:deoxyribonuclease V [Smithellaceae bacterium]